MCSILILLKIQNRTKPSLFCGAKILRTPRVNPLKQSDYLHYFLSETTTKQTDPK